MVKKDFDKLPKKKKPSEEINYDKLLFRLTAILRKLSDDDRPTLNELAEEFNVSIRTIQRDIRRLMNFPIETDEERRLCFAYGFSLKRTKLSTEELTTMAISLNQIRGAGGKFKSATENLFYKLLENHNPSSPYHIKPRSFEKFDLDSALVKNIENAIYYNQISNIEMQQRTTTVEPYKIVNLDGIWYLLAKDLQDSKIKTFFLSKIKTFSATHDTFIGRKDIDTVLSGVYSGFFEDGNSFEVIVKVHQKIAGYFKLKNHLPSQEIIEEMPKGDLMIRFQVTAEEDIDNIIKSWLPDIEVISPQGYADKLKSEIVRYIEQLDGKHS